jgi:DNA-directed RNA polymerase specialized sigma24 family protein
VPSPQTQARPRRRTQSQAPGASSALAQLCQLYWYPLYAFARRWGQTPEDAQDLTQGFFLQLLDHRLLAAADQRKGKFRSFLLAAFQHYLSDQADRARCLKRGGHYEFISLDLEGAEDRYQREPADGALTAEQLFDARWAILLLGRAKTLLAQEIARTVSDPGEVDAEIHALCEALIASEGRLDPSLLRFWLLGRAPSRRTRRVG